MTPFHRLRPISLIAGSACRCSLLLRSIHVVATHSAEPWSTSCAAFMPVMCPWSRPRQAPMNGVQFCRPAITQTRFGIFRAGTANSYGAGEWFVQALWPLAASASAHSGQHAALLWCPVLVRTKLGRTPSPSIYPSFEEAVKWFSRPCLPLIRLTFALFVGEGTAVVASMRCAPVVARGEAVISDSRIDA